MKSLALKAMPPIGENFPIPYSFWIDELSAWIAADEVDLEYLREALGPEAKILLPSELPPP